MNSPTLHPPTARTTGLLYLAMAVAAVPGFLVIRPLLFDPESPLGTLTHLVENEQLARVGIGLELTLVVLQALTALWFFRLFRHVDAFAAGSVAVFGLVNAVAVLGSAAGLATALEAALAGDAAGSQLMYVLSGNLWGVGALFFGLWLVPMGLLALGDAAGPGVGPGRRRSRLRGQRVRRLPGARCLGVRGRAGVPRDRRRAVDHRRAAVARLPS